MIKGTGQKNIKAAAALSADFLIFMILLFAAGPFHGLAFLLFSVSVNAAVRAFPADTEKPAEKNRLRCAGLYIFAVIFAAVSAAAVFFAGAMPDYSPGAGEIYAMTAALCAAAAVFFLKTQGPEND